MACPIAPNVTEQESAADHRPHSTEPLHQWQTDTRTMSVTWCQDAGTIGAACRSHWRCLSEPLALPIGAIRAAYRSH